MKIIIFEIGIVNILKIVPTLFFQKVAATFDIIFKYSLYTFSQILIELEEVKI